MSSKITKASSRVKFAEIENGISEFWKQNKIFEKSIENRAKAPKYSFVDGPPFVTGNPHYGSLLPSIAKDIIPRYQTMKGKQVRRVFGWDCHGLPIEQIVSDKLGLKTRDQIVEFGVDKYIQECRKHVLECIDNWQWYIDKIGRWVDTDNAYYTMNPEFNESVLWLFKQAWDKDLIYKGKRVSLFSTDNSNDRNKLTLPEWSKHIEVLWDDRADKGLGEKLKDADLIGCPVQLIVSKRSLENFESGIEFKVR